MRKLFAPALLLAFALLPSGMMSGASWAADRDTCIAYAGQATSKAVEDAMAVCGYSGDAWNPGDFIGHLNWCLGASAQTVKAEQDKRQAAVAKCDKCKTYASGAVAAQTMNDPEEKLKTTYAPQGVKGNPFPLPPMACGYSGDAWSGDFNAHARWCAGVSEDDARRETEKRNGLITICEGCRNYAHRAVASYLAIWPKCRHFWSNPSMSDPRWSTDHRNHFQWCMSLPNNSRFSRADGEHRARDLVIEACNTSQSKAPLTIQTPTSVEAVKKGPAKRATKRDSSSNTATAVDARKPSADAVKASTKKQSARQQQLGDGSARRRRQHSVGRGQLGRRGERRGEVAQRLGRSGTFVVGRWWWRQRRGGARDDAQPQYDRSRRLARAAPVICCNSYTQFTVCV